MKYETFIKNDVAYVVIPLTLDTERVQPIITKETFIECYEKWIEPIKSIKHGKWIKNEDRSGWHCSCCGKDDLYAYPYTENNERELQDFYCPYCGAKMDESGENNG